NHSFRAARGPLPAHGGRLHRQHRGLRATVGAAHRLPAPAHSHDHYEETIYGLDGVLTWTVDGRPIEVGPGQALCIPRGAIHRFDNLGSQDARALCVITPAAIGPQYFRE